MAGTKEGWLKAKATMVDKWGEDGYHKHMQAVGAIGGRVSRGGGFAADHELARVAGGKGGRAFRKTGPYKKKVDGPYEIHGVIDGVKRPAPVEHEAIDIEEYTPGQAQQEGGWDKWLKKVGLK